MKRPRKLAPHPRVRPATPDPLTLVQCHGRPHVIGAGTFLVALHLFRARHRLGGKN